MRSIRPCLAAAPLLVLCAPALAQSDAPPSVDDQLRQVREEMDRLRIENAQMRQEIGDLRAATDAEWKDERRAEEIRAVVQDVLADADERASLQDGLVAGWSNGFFLASPDGRFRLNFEGQLQTRFIFNWTDAADASTAKDQTKYGFENTRTKLTLSGHVFRPEMTYLVRTDATRNERGLVTGLFFLRDAWVRYQLNNDWSIRAGLFKLPFSREELVSSQYQLAVERSLVGETLGVGRSHGVELTWTGETQRVMFAFSNGGQDNIWGLGNIIGTNPPYQPWSTTDAEYAFTARYEALFAGDWRQFRDFTSPPGEDFAAMFGFAAHIQKGEYNGAPSLRRNEPEWWNWTADLSIEWGGANFFASGHWNYADNGNFANIPTYGIVFQGGWYIDPKNELFARWEYGWTDFATSDFHDLHELTLGWNWYLDGHDVKLTTDLGIAFGPVDLTFDEDIAGWRRQFDGSDTQFVLRTQFQLLF